MKKLLAMVSFLALISTHAFAVENYLILKSSENNHVQISYSPYTYLYNSNRPSSSLYAASLKILVSGPSVTTSSKIRVILLNYRQTEGQCGVPNSSDRIVYRMDLSVVSGRGVFQGIFSDDAEVFFDNDRWYKVSQYADPGLLVYTNGYCYNTYANTEVAVVIDGVWQTDPVNGSNNFKVNF
ncbi:MAG: hypothetical protein WCG27_12080 [Pseudomonadota bacterium]